MTNNNQIEWLKSIMGRDLVLEKGGDLIREILYPRECIIQRMNEDLTEDSGLSPNATAEEIMQWRDSDLED